MSPPAGGVHLPVPVQPCQLSAGCHTVKRARLVPGPAGQCPAGARLPGWPMCLLVPAAARVVPAVQQGMHFCRAQGCCVHPHTFERMRCCVMAHVWLQSTCGGLCPQTTSNMVSCPCVAVRAALSCQRPAHWHARSAGLRPPHCCSLRRPWHCPGCQPASCHAMAPSAATFAALQRHVLQHVADYNGQALSNLMRLFACRASAMWAGGVRWWCGGAWGGLHMRGVVCFGSSRTACECLACMQVCFQWDFPIAYHNAAPAGHRAPAARVRRHL